MSSKPVAGKGYSPSSKHSASPPKQETPSKISPPKGQSVPAKQVEQPKSKAPEPPKQKAPEPKKSTIKAPEAPSKGGFDARKYAVNGITEEEVTVAKSSFDLFDSDQGGTVDIKCTILIT